jgi:hypothetical protein
MRARTGPARQVARARAGGSTCAAPSIAMSAMGHVRSIAWAAARSSRCAS